MNLQERDFTGQCTFKRKRCFKKIPWGNTSQPDKKSGDGEYSGGGGGLDRGRGNSMGEYKKTRVFQKHSVQTEDF